MERRIRNITELGPDARGQTTTGGGRTATAIADVSKSRRQHTLDNILMLVRKLDPSSHSHSSTSAPADSGRSNPDRLGSDA